MSLYILDTDILSLYWEGEPLVTQRVREHQATELAITVISVEEQLSGWYTLVRQARQPAQQAHAYQRLADYDELAGRCVSAADAGLLPSTETKP
jgi:tRNA(fMet)-specific endonuclease VapC